MTETPAAIGALLAGTSTLSIADGDSDRLYEALGAHPIEHEGRPGVHFAVWAPNASAVSVVGDFNGWDGASHPLRRHDDSGVWSLFVPEIGTGALYKYRIVGVDGTVLPLKADPFGFAAELRPATASIVAVPGQARWTDDAYRQRWATLDPRREPISIYEVHAGSWQRGADGGFLSWDELAERLIPYVVDLGFTHIEFLPLGEHPYDPSWGYQTTGLFAPSSRFGDGAGFARFVDRAHGAGVGVLVDWVPAHFPTDEHGLYRFDGTPLYEHADPRLGFHPDWTTAIYDYGRPEVARFLVSNALFWADKYHVDGLRVDAVSSMLYRDYSRKDGEWLPNADGGNENWEAVDLLRATNRALYRAFPGIITMAEESSSWPGVSHPAFDESPRTSLGFGFKWNLGVLHDTLQFMGRAFAERAFYHGEITFGLAYAFAENFVLPVSHDDVVHGKGSLLTKMSGDEAEQFANLRAFLALLWGHPGKKLMFMGQEFAQRREWDQDRALDWHLADTPAHRGVRNLIGDLNRLYRSEAALHARDCESEGFEWLVVDDAANSVFAWLRKAPGARPVAVIANMLPVAHDGYAVPLPKDGIWTELLNSDAAWYGGADRGNRGAVRCEKGAAQLVLPALGTVMLGFEEG